MTAAGSGAAWCLPPGVEMRVLPRVLRRSHAHLDAPPRRQREIRSAPHVRYWPAVSVRHSTFRPVHVDGVLCWLWQPHRKPEPEETPCPKTSRRYPLSSPTR